jgi:hypothetical protein
LNERGACSYATHFICFCFDFSELSVGSGKLRLRRGQLCSQRRQLSLRFFQLGFGCNVIVVLLLLEQRVGS